MNKHIYKALFDVLVYYPVYIKRGSYIETDTPISFTISDGQRKSHFDIQKKSIKSDVESVRKSIEDNFIKIRLKP